MDTIVESRKPNNVAFKVFLIFLLQVVFVFILSFFLGLLAWYQINNGASYGFVEITTTLLFLIISTYLALLVLSKKFVKEDIVSIPKWLALVNLIWGILYLVADHTLITGILNIIAAPILEYGIAYLFLKNKFKSAPSIP